MQCPSCDHEAPQAAFGDPLRCPDCGAFYEKALELKLKREAAITPKQAPAQEQEPPQRLGKGMVLCASCGKPISKNAVRGCPHCGAAPKKKTSPFTWIVVGLLVLWGIGALSGKPSSTATTASSSVNTAPTRLDPLDEAKAKTVLVDYKWAKTAGGSLMQADFTIHNGSAVPVKDFEMTCTHFGPSKTRIDSNTRTIYEVIEPGKTRTFKNFDMGFIHSQAVSSSCVIADLKI